MPTVHYLTVDMEDWFQVFYGEDVIDRQSWSTYESAIAPMLDASLELFEANHVKATFFVVGWLAKQFPALVRKISAQGHEVASHGYWHQETHKQTLEDFNKDIRLAKEVLEQTVGKAVRGFRAPGHSIPSAKHPAIDSIREAGYRYDCSILETSAAPYEIRPGLLEIPSTGIGAGGKYYPINGGFVFRAMPYALYRWYVKSMGWRGQSLNFYTHTWEIYPNHPRIRMPFPKSFVQYFNSPSVKPKLARLFHDASFTSIEQGCALLSGR